MLKAFSSENFLSAVEKGPKMAVFGAKGVKSFAFGFATHKRHIFERNRVI